MKTIENVRDELVSRISSRAGNTDDPVEIHQLASALATLAGMPTVLPPPATARKRKGG